MSAQIESQVFDFLQNIEENNNKEWFLNHKNDYNKAFTNVERFINELIKEIAKFDATVSDQTASKCIYRIYRDLRFSPDKRPYKIHFGAYVAMGGKNANTAGYYVHIQKNMSMLAAGLWCPVPNMLKKRREEIYYNPEELHNILHEKQFAAHWGGLDDSNSLKRVPLPYPKDFEYASLLKYKSFCTMKAYSDKKVCGANFLQECAENFKSSVSLVNYMNYIIQL